MNTQQITASNATAEIRNLYETSFPVEEQIPWTDLMRLVDVMSLDFTAYYDDALFVGFTIVYPRKEFNWYWYFAVQPDLRGQGYGQRILSQLIDHYQGQPCVLDMESPTQPSDNIAQRQRRHDFYLRNGFHDTGVYRYFDDLCMTIMMMGEHPFSMQDWDVILEELRSKLTIED